MVNETNMIVRRSGKSDSSYYIDYSGIYKVLEISKATGMSAPALKELYVSNGATYDADQDVYYFSSFDGAKKVIGEILKNTKAELKGRAVYLTENEIEYIRKALINEQSNTIHVKNKIKDAIFKKLNV